MSRRTSQPSKQEGQLPLFDDLPLCISIWPNDRTMAHDVLMRLLNGERLTQISYGFRSWRLAAHIGELFKLCFPIKRLDVPNPHGGERPIREYYLSADDIYLLRNGDAQ
jgi:hypothetical protein